MSTELPSRDDLLARVRARSASLRRRRLAARAAGALAIVAVLGTGVAVAWPSGAGKPSRLDTVAPPAPTDTTTETTSRPTGPTSPATSAVPAPTLPGPTTGATPSTTPPTSFGYQPLYPFASVADARAWQQQSATTGSQPWHLDAGQTALSLVGFLGYDGDVDQVIDIAYAADGAHVSVGWKDTGYSIHVAAVIHEVRIGDGPDAPWEVVGTDDTGGLSLTTPAYGATVSSPVVVGGRITGVDENIKVAVRGLSSATPVGEFCCVPAGDVNTPWQATVAFGAQSDPVLVVAASTGGHLKSVERFAVTGIRPSH